MSETISVTTTVAMVVVRRWLTRVPITLRLRQKISKGIRAKGMPKESTTWLRTSERLGLRPTAKHDEGREHRDEASEPQWDAPVDKTLHDHLAAQRTHRGA